LSGILVHPAQASKQTNNKQAQQFLKSAGQHRHTSGALFSSIGSGPVCDLLSGEKNVGIAGTRRHEEQGE
jgi:hypothetical protein